jgi:hypothetical protein
MNKIVNNLPLIASALEYYDPKTGGAWRVRNALTGAVIWSAHRVLKLKEQSVREVLVEVAMHGEDPPVGMSLEALRIIEALKTFHTTLTWANDAQDGSFILDLSERGVENALGLTRKVDVHGDACKLAREKCMRIRNAKRFVEYYKEALAQVEEQRKTRMQMVDGIVGMINEGAHHAYYDEDCATREAERIEEAIFTALEATHAAAKADLDGAVSPTKINRASAAVTALETMYKALGYKPKEAQRGPAQSTKNLIADLDEQCKKVEEENSRILKEADEAARAAGIAT